MASPLVVPLTAQIVPHYRGNSARFYFTPRVRCSAGILRFQACLLDSGIAISVLPREIRQALGVQVDPLPGWRGRPVPPWCGIPCRIGRIWLEEAGVVFNPLVRIPVRRTPWAQPFIRLGTEFLHHQRAEVRLYCDSNLPPQPYGELILP